MGKVADRDGMRTAFSQRLHEVVDRVVETTDLATIEKVLSMADPFSGMGVAMHQAATADAAALRDPLAGSPLRGVEARVQLVDEAGGLPRLSQVADRLGGHSPGRNGATASQDDSRSADAERGMGLSSLSVRRR
jgi:hypothetical protein